MASVVMVCSTTVENILQIGFFMQNKANFRKSQMGVKSIMTSNYDKKPNWTFGENKPNFKTGGRRGFLLRWVKYEELALLFLTVFGMLLKPGGLELQQVENPQIHL